MRLKPFALTALALVAAAGLSREGNAETLFESGAKWSYYKGNDHPSGGDLEWTESDFDDSDWPSGASPIRYGDGNGGTVLGDMLADTPLAKIDDIEFVRTVAVARITMPMSMVRLSAGRESMSEATQALCFLAGANSIFTGDKLLTAPNAGDDTDAALFAKLGLTALQQEEPMRACKVAEPAE